MILDCVLVADVWLRSLQLKDRMNFSLANGIWMGAAVLLLIIVFCLPFLVGRQNFQQRVVVPIYDIHDFLSRFWSDPRSKLFHTTVQILQYFRKAYGACKRWLGRFHARKLQPRLKGSNLTLLPLHRRHPTASHRSQTQTTGRSASFIDLPFDIRLNIYQEFIQLFPRARWNITNTLKADSNFLDAMAFIRTCKLVREELGPRMFQSLKFETDAKYPFYHNLPASLTGEIRNLSLVFRPSMGLESIHHVLLRQLQHIQALSRFTVTVPARLLVDLDRELEHILRRFKMANPTLGALTVMTRVSLPTPTDNLVLSQAMTRLVGSLLPWFSLPPAFRASVWTKDAGRGRFRPATAWLCRISTADDPEWEGLPEEVEGRGEGRADETMSQVG